MATEGRALATVAIGLVFALFLAGLVEGFVTGWALPWPVKIGIGGAALAVFLIYMVVIGGRAHRRGETGDLLEYEAGTPRLIAADPEALPPRIADRYLELKAAGRL